MEYLTLSNGIPMPLVGFGTFMLGGEPCINAVSTAIQSGYRLIDTAEAYGNEKAVGEGIKQSGIDRGALFLVTKVNFKSYDNTRQTVENSLRLLKTDYLDLVLLHWPFADYYTAWRELETLHAESKIRSIGVSNFEPDRLVDLIAYNKVKPAVNRICIANAKQSTNGRTNTTLPTWRMRHSVKARRIPCLPSLSCGNWQRSTAKHRRRFFCAARCRTE